MDWKGNWCYTRCRYEISSHLKAMSLTVTVSTQADLRDDIRTLVQENVNHNVRFLELEYQPADLGFRSS